MGNKKHELNAKVWHIPTKKEVTIDKVYTAEHIDIYKKHIFDYTYDVFTTDKRRDLITKVEQIELSIDHPDKKYMDEIKKLKKYIKQVEHDVNKVESEIIADMGFSINDTAIFTGNGLNRPCVVKGILEKKGKKRAYVVFTDDGWLTCEAEVGIENLQKK